MTLCLVQMMTHLNALTAAQAKGLAIPHRLLAYLGMSCLLVSR